MSKIEQLLKKLCPNGVEYKPMGEVAKICRGVRVVKKELSVTGNFEVYQNSLKPLGYYDKANVQGGTAFVIGAGAAGEVGYSANDFWAADDCYYIDGGDRLIGRYVYYCLTSRQAWLSSKVRKASIPRLSRDFVSALEIPLPPIEIQREVVVILDNFAQLEAELEAELTKRKKQYEHYRDIVLDVSADQVELGSVIKSLNTGLNPRKFFRLNTDDAENYYVTIREMHGGRIEFSDKTDRINDEALRLCNHRSNLEAGDVLFSGTGTIGEMVVIEETPRNWNIKEGVYTIKPDQSRLLPKYLRYILMSSPVRQAYMSKIAGGTVKSIPMGELKKVKIPLPPLAEQERIVGILDRFDALCNSLSEGLPAEIERRKKQYAFYRDKLLAFRNRNEELRMEN